MNGNVPGTPNDQARTVRWGIIPLLAVAGVVSSLETEISIIRSELNGGGNPTSTVLLGGLCLGLTIVTALWFYKRIQSWGTAALLVSVTVAANCSPLFYKYVPASLYQNKDLPLLGTTALYHFAFMFPSCLVAFIGFALVLLRKALWTVSMAILSACLATLFFVFIVDQQRGAWFSFWSDQPLSLLWQNTLASFLGLSLWLGEITIKRGSSSPPQPSRIRTSGSSRRNALISLGILVAYFIGLHAWTRVVINRYGRMVKQYQARVIAESARSLAEAPSRENLPPPEEIPIDSVFLTQKIAAWSPVSSDSRILPAEIALPAYAKPNSRALLPQRYSSSVAYWDGGNGMRLRIAEVTTYSTQAWARYELRHIPQDNEMINRPEAVTKVVKFGNNLYHDGPYFYWTSGTKLVVLNFIGIHESMIDDFLDAYLEKYPSSL